MSPTYLFGLDLGQAQDYSALIIVEQQREGKQARYDVRHIERFQLGTPYPAMVEQVCGRYRHPTFDESDTILVIDATGCGRPVVDMFVRCKPIAVSIHGGDQVHRDGRNYRVPKRDLVACAQVLLQQRRLKFAEALPLTATLQQELLNFRMKIDPLTAHDSYSAWREGQHDDLVLATALACWWGEKGPKPGRVVFI